MSSTPSLFTDAERQVLALLQQGINPHQIAKLKGVHLNTIRVRIASLRHKALASTISELLERAELPMEVLAQEFEKASTVAPPSAEQLAASERAAQCANLEFYRLLGPERPGTSCRAAGCLHGTIKHSVLCRQHHYELIRREACPFEGDA